jgi:hypothetical protein
MNRKEIDVVEFRAALRLIEDQRQMLKNARAEEGLTLAIEAILRYLHRLPPGQLDKLRGVHPKSTEAFKEKQSYEKSVADLGLDDVQKILDDEDTPRYKLEGIAIGRFKVPRGSMRSMGAIDQLRETLRTYVRNERAHESISKVAQGQS